MAPGVVINDSVAAQGLNALLAGRDTRWYRGYLGRLNLMCMLLVITQMANGFDGSMMNNLQTLTVWQDYFHHPQGSLLGVFNSIQSIGGIAGLPVAPYLNDWLGRRMTVFIGAIIIVVGVVLQGTAQNIGMFIGARFCIGVGISICATGAATLLTEISYPSHRAPITSFFNGTYNGGAIVAAWSTFGTFHIASNWSWRIPSLLQGVPSIIQIIFIFFIPESPRWLVAKGKEEQARAVLTRWHAGGVENDPLVEFEMAEIKSALAVESELHSSVSWISLFNNKGNLKRMRIIIAIGFFSQWSGNGLVSYYLNLVLKGVGIRDTSQQLIFNGVLQVYNFATASAGAMVVDKVGRRKLWLTSAGGMCITFIFWTLGSALFAKSAVDVNADRLPIHPNKAAGHLVLAMIFIYYGFYNIAMSALLVSYTVEILPFRIRSKGYTVMSLCVSAALTLNQYANPLALKALDWKYYIVYTVWLAVEFVVLYFWVIETKGKNGILPLEEIAQLFDGEDAKEEVRQSAVQQTVESGAFEQDKVHDERVEEKY